MDRSLSLPSSSSSRKGIGAAAKNFLVRNFFFSSRQEAKEERYNKLWDSINVGDISQEGVTEFKKLHREVGPQLTKPLPKKQKKSGKSNKKKKASQQSSSSN